MEGVGQYEMWFGIGKCKTKFSKQEFCLVIGLKFGTLSSIATNKYVPVNGGIHERYFGSLDILGITLQDMFTEQIF